MAVVASGSHPDVASFLAFHAATAASATAASATALPQPDWPPIAELPFQRAAGLPQPGLGPLAAPAVGALAAERALNPLAAEFRPQQAEEPASSASDSTKPSAFGGSGSTSPAEEDLSLEEVEEEAAANCAQS